MHLNLVSSLLGALFPPRCEAISELIPGRRARVRGQVTARDLIDSTLTGEHCVYYHYAVEEWRNTHMAGLASEGHWTITRYDEAIVEFYLQDESAERLIVAPHRARIQRAPRVTPNYVDMGIMGQRAYELVLKPGDWVEIEGQVEIVRDLYDQERSYRSDPTRYMLSAPPGDWLDVRLL